MPKAIIIYHTETTDMKLLAERILHRLQDLGAQVAAIQDKHFKDFETIQDYDIIALGAPCLNCKNCHRPEECRAAKHLRRNLKKLFKMNLKDKKLITFAHSPDPEKNQWVRRRIEALIAPSRNKLIASIGYTGNPKENLDQALKTAITEQTIK
jgi:menaquinone-dependent protoporphyrinogen IX oxidase